MGLFPDLLAAESPGRPDSDEPIALCVLNEYARIEDEDAKSDRHQDIYIDPDSNAPKDGKGIDRKEKEKDEGDEVVEVAAEGLDILL